MKDMTVQSSNDAIWSENHQTEGEQLKTPIIITQCPTEPCRHFYTDTITESILIECRDPRHLSLNSDIVIHKKEQAHQYYDC